MYFTTNIQKYPIGGSAIVWRLNRADTLLAIIQYIIIFRLCCCYPPEIYCYLRDNYSVLEYSSPVLLYPINPDLNGFYRLFTLCRRSAGEIASQTERVEQIKIGCRLLSQSAWNSTFEWSTSWLAPILLKKRVNGLVDIEVAGIHVAITAQYRSSERE